MVELFKQQLKDMRKEARPGDEIPADVFFAFMDTMIAAIDAVVEENKNLKESNGK